jgi:hypothetical protein
LPAISNGGFTEEFARMSFLASDKGSFADRDRWGLDVDTSAPPLGLTVRFGETIFPQALCSITWLQEPNIE